MTLKSIKTYQAVQFQHSLHNYFAERPAFVGLELKLLPEGLVSIKTDKDHILVPLTNIAFVVPMTKETKGRDTSREPTLMKQTTGNPRD